MIRTLLADAELLALAARLRPDREARDTLARITWSTITEPGDSTGGALRSQHGVAAALEWALSDLMPAPGDAGISEARKRWFPRANADFVREAARSALHIGVGAIFPSDRLWPAVFGDLGPHAPAMLWARGSIDTLRHDAGPVSLVGARASTPYGEQVARELAGDLATTGHVIVSGGAYGIDGCAHRAAIGVGGRTIAFLAGGVDRAYPAGHVPLFRDIAASGLLLSELPCGYTPTKWRFLARNRLIGALGGATVVVEAGSRSGSLNTAGHAASLGRPLGAVPGPITSASSAGCHRLLREYDARCITSAADVRELLGYDAEVVAHAADRETPERIRLRDALSSRSFRTPLEIAQKSGLSVEGVEALLGLLALEGEAQRSDEGWRLVG